jgi:general secretion pathway protein D
LLMSVLCMSGAWGEAGAQEHRAGIAGSESEAAADPGAPSGVPIERIVAAVAAKTGKRYLIDPRVHGSVQILGQNIAAVSYSDLLSILELQGFTAVQGGDYINVIPITEVRQMPLPLFTGKENYPDAQFVTGLIAIKSVSAASLVPLLRPLLPTYGHLAAMPCSGNTLLIVDRFANVKRLEKMISALDVGAPYVPRACEGEPARAAGAARP